MLKVYGWTGWRNECPPSANGGKQTREIVAARSKAEVYRITGDRVSDHWCICTTGNEEEIAVAMSNPGTVFWKKLNSYTDDYVEVKKGG